MADGHTSVGSDFEGARGVGLRDRLLAGRQLHDQLWIRWRRAALACRDSRRSRRSPEGKSEKPVKPTPLLLTFGGTGSSLYGARWSADGTWSSPARPSWDEIAAAEAKE